MKHMEFTKPLTLRKLKQLIKDKKIGKKERTKQYLLMGKTLTGTTFGKVLYIENYRDKIYHLRRDLDKLGLGIKIVGVPEPHSDGSHHRWFIPREHIKIYYKFMAGKQ